MIGSKTILNIYDAMYDALGPSHWWPGDTPFEIAVGAILTQNTNWKNVEKAIGNLKQAKCLEPRRMAALSQEKLADLIRPAGYFNIKANRLHNFLGFLEKEAEFEIERLANKELVDLRTVLLSVKGIGPETADSILLYALGYPTFVVDAYTHRMFTRHGIAYEDIDYHGLQAIFMDALPVNVSLYNEYHALIVRVGKNWCKKKAGLCDVCPLRTLL